ncbi:hypothetical protein PFISCL1PPCAC_22825, partial [Pristionchus fissidentatus]
ILICMMTTVNAQSSYHGDPSKQEVEMFEWTSGIRLPFCVDAPIADVGALFKKAFASYVTAYCSVNREHCNILNSVTFQSQHVMFLDGFPRREFDSLNLRFMVIIPHESKTKEKQVRPLLSRSVLSSTTISF